MRNRAVGRRGVLGAGVVAAAWAVGLTGRKARGDEPAERTLRLRVSETAGLRRFSYPVRALLPDAPEGTNFRLERDGKAVLAQFRRVAGADGRPAVVLDFNASPGPMEAETYLVRSGPGVEPGPEPKRGMSVERVGDEFQVSNGSVLVYRLPATIRLHPYGVFGPDMMPKPGGRPETGPAGKNAILDRMIMPGLPVRSGATLAIDKLFLRVRNADLPFVPSILNTFVDLDRFLSDKAWVGPEVQSALDFRGVISRRGPLAVGLRYDGFRAKKDGPPRSVLEMTFPSSKSWVEVSWAVDDDGGAVSDLVINQSLRTEGGPTLVDLGARNTVYGHLRRGEALSLSAGEAPGVLPLKTDWVVSKETGQKSTTFAEAPGRHRAEAEGWAHVMDRDRCTAVAVADFGHATRDTIRVQSDGGLSLSRVFAAGQAPPPKSRKGLRFWLHFVPMPVQVGALTSPQAMLAPLRVSLEPDRG